MDELDGVTLELVCPCGYEHFQRVVVERVMANPIVTDFVACVGCKTMYWAPEVKLVPPVRRLGETGHGGPPLAPRQSHDEFMREVRELAKEYVKPGRHKPPRGRR